MNFAKRILASTLIVSTTLVGIPLTAQAGIVGTASTLPSAAAATPTADQNRERVTSFLARADVQTALQERGVQGSDAMARVQSMSDAEVAELAGRVDQAPVGGDILGLVFTVFIILLVTDILGLTKVFPFTRAVR